MRTLLKSNVVPGEESERPQDERPVRVGRVVGHAADLRGRGRLHPAPLLPLQVITTAVSVDSGRGGPVTRCAGRAVWSDPGFC